MTSLILKWRTKTSEILITKMKYDHLMKAITTVKNRLRSYKKQQNILNALQEEKYRREEQAKKIALQDIAGLTEENIILVDTTEMAELDQVNRKDYYTRLAEGGQIVSINFE